MNPLTRATGAALAVGLAGGAWMYAARWPESQLFGRTLVAGRDPDEAALTFDDGPNGDTTLRLLDLLSRHGVPATFFLIGRYVRAQPEVVRAIAAAGHVVGNHTMTHPWLHVQGDARIRREIGDTSAVLEDVLGARVRYFRVPYGARRPYVLQYARELGMVPVQWNVMGIDWTTRDSAVIVDRVTRGLAWNRRLGRGSNILLHDGGDGGAGTDRTPTLQAVDRLLAGFPESGTRAVAVDRWG